MSEFTLESESIDVERIMEQIRARVREKRDESYTEERIRTLANATLERFFDPTHVHSSMVAYYQKRLQEKQHALRTSPDVPPSFTFDPETIYRSSRGISGRVLYGIRKLLNPILKFFFNPTPIVQALTMQQQINERQAEVISQMARTQTEFVEIAALNYEVMNHLVVEMTRLSLEMKSHKMLVESVAGRLDFDERRVRAPQKPADQRPRSRVGSDDADAGAEKDKRRRRRRRGRRRSTGTAPGSAAAAPNQEAGESAETANDAAPVAETSAGASAAVPAGPADSPAQPQGDAAPLEPADTSSPSEKPDRTAASEPAPPTNVPDPPATGSGSSEQ